MQIEVKPTDNGWIVIDKSGRKNKTSVFIDREKMMEHINDILPLTLTEQGFVDGLDDEEDCEDEWDDCQTYEADSLKQIQDAILKHYNKIDTQYKSICKSV